MSGSHGRGPDHTRVIRKPEEESRKHRSIPRFQITHKREVQVSRVLGLQMIPISASQPRQKNLDLHCDLECCQLQQCPPSWQRSQRWGWINCPWWPEVSYSLHTSRIAGVAGLLLGGSVSAFVRLTWITRLRHSPIMQNINPVQPCHCIQERPDIDVSASHCGWKIETRIHSYKRSTLWKSHNFKNLGNSRLFWLVVLEISGFSFVCNSLDIPNRWA